MKKLIKIENLVNVLLMTVGILGGLNYYSKKEYWICGIMFFIGIVYAYKLFQSLMGK